MHFPAPLPSHTVAFVDDAALWLRPMADVVSLHTSRVYLYSNALEALEQIPKRRPSAVVMGHRTAYADGIDIARALVARLGSQCPRLILLTEWGARLGEADSSLFFEIHEKPVSRAMLLGILARAATVAHDLADAAE